ncbi:MAG: transglycosylase SLT domain-containing protein [Anaerolineae bacterium]
MLGRAMKRAEHHGAAGIWVAGAVLLLALLVGLGLLLHLPDLLLSPAGLYREAQQARPARAATLYARLGDKVPEIAEYTRLWAAEAALPDPEAVVALRDVIVLRPKSPVAVQAWIALARYYAGQGDPAAADAYREALVLDDDPIVRLELARCLEELGDVDAAYAEYTTLLQVQPDSFAAMRRLGADNLTMAEDLNAAYYNTDVLEVLRGDDSSGAVLWRAKALAALGENEQAEAAYRTWLEAHPEDDQARLGLARVVRLLGRSDDALALYRAVDHPDSALAQAEMLEESAPDEALELYLECPYPVAWWAATGLLEAQGRLTETLPIYARVANADTNLVDDAAYRLRVLARRLGDADRLAEAEALLREEGNEWLALQAEDGSVSLPAAAPAGEEGQETLAKVAALEAIGCDQEAIQELRLGARFQASAGADLAFAQALLERGLVSEAQAIGAEHTEGARTAPRALWELSYPRAYETEVEAAAAEFGVDPLLLWAIMRQESVYDATAYGGAGERGLMQVLPDTQDWIAEQWGRTISPGEAFTPATSVRMAAWFLDYLLEYYDGDVSLTIAAYNGGAGNVDAWQSDPLVSDRDDWLRWIGFGSTREYLENVSTYYLIYQALYGQETTAAR